MNSPRSSDTCPKCRVPLDPSAPRGLCPACLMDAAGMETESFPAAAGDGLLSLDVLRRAFPQLEILAPLGAGGMGRVYKVRQPNLDRIAALKILPPEYAHDPGWVERFTREARALARLNHPNIVQIYDVGQSSGGPGGTPLCWLLMEFVDGVTLRQVQRTGGLSSREALSLVPRLCDALQYAHEKGVLHRDIKPENILLDSSGTVKVADFGLAKLGGVNPAPTLTMAGARLGTAAYMAPEQFESPGDVDHRADIYSLGVVLYELLTGGLPLGRFPAPSEKSGIDPRLDQIVFRTLEKERDRRYQAAGEVRTALETVAAGPQPPPLPAENRKAGAAPAPQPAPPHGAPVPAQPRVMQSRPVPYGYAGAAPGEVRNVTFHERPHGSRGCGGMLLVPLKLALALAPGLLPLIWYAITREMYRAELPGVFPGSMPIVGAVTGLLAWLLAGPFLTSIGVTDREWVKRKAPLFLLLALTIWTGVLYKAAKAVPSYPNQGVLKTLHFSCLRPAQAPGETQSPEDRLDTLWATQVQKEFGRDSGAVWTGDKRMARYPYYHSDGEASPLRKYWYLTAVGETEQGIYSRLTRLCENLAAELPESVRGSVIVRIDNSIKFDAPGALALRRDETFALLGISMTLGGWLAALCRRRPVWNGSVPVLLAIVGAGVWWLPAVPLLVTTVTPLPDANPGTAPVHRIWNELREKPAAGGDTGVGVIVRWIDACRRLDRPAVEALSQAAVKDDEWNWLVSVWDTGVLLSLTDETASARLPRDAAAQFSAQVFVMGGKHTDDPFYAPRYNGNYPQVPLYTTSTVKFVVTKTADGAWKVQQGR